MPQTIRNGFGGPVVDAKVNERGRVSVQAISESEAVAANELGDAYNINTGFITLTDDNETAVLYFKNNEQRDYIVELIVIGTGPSTGGSGIVKSKFIRNPTTGTIVSSATAVDVNSNRNYGSTKTITVDAYKGATGNTITNGDDHIIVKVNSDNRNVFGINEIIPFGTSIGVNFTPPSGNTSMEIYVALVY